MPMGRPPLRFSHVDSLEGSAEQQRRLRVILETISGETSVEEACRRLDLSKSQFHNVRARALQGAIDALAPRPPGRPRRPATGPVPEVTELQEQVADLQIELLGAQLRTELALTMPHVLETAKKKVRRPRRR